jgi:hypothetical protein
VTIVSFRADASSSAISVRPVFINTLSHNGTRKLILTNNIVNCLYKEGRTAVGLNNS